MAKKADTPKVIQLPADEPLVLVGEPKRIKGQFRLANTGDQPVIVRDGLLRAAPEKKGRGKSKTPALEIRKPLHPIRLKAGDSRSVKVKMAVDPFTPPGEYEAELEVGGEVRAVTVHVTEKLDLNLNPSKLVLRAAPGATVSRRIVVRNNGNVPLTIGEIGAVVLEDERIECRVLRRVVAAIDADKSKQADMTDYFKLMVSQVHEVLSQSGALRVHSKTGTVTIAPGAIQPIDLEIRVPDSLDRRTRYLASVPIYNRNLVFEVAPILNDQDGKDIG